MTNPFHSSRYSVAVSLLAGIFLGAVLWLRSDPPPYSYPHQEGNEYYSHMVDIAHKWRSLNIFTFWDNGIGGGLSNFTACTYPILNPLNAVAWILTDDQFQIFFLVAPFVTGLFFTMLLLLEVFGLRLPYALLGSLYYLGLGLARNTILPESPQSLWGCFLLPAGLFCYFKLASKDAYGATAMVGMVLAFHFSISGVFSIPQNILWWLYFLSAGFLLALKKLPLLQNLKHLILCALLLGIISAGMFATQFIPLYNFVANESARPTGGYSINTLPLAFWSNWLPLYVTQPMGVSMFGIYALLLTALALVFAHGKHLLASLRNRSSLVQMWLAMGLYIVFPSILEFLVTSSSSISSLLSPLTKFNLQYALNTLDFCVAVTLAVILGQEQFQLSGATVPYSKRFPILMLIVSALLVGAVPLVRDPRAGTLTVLIITSIGIGYIFWRPTNRRVYPALGTAFAVLGFMTTNTVYVYNDKGKRSHFADYQTETPEYKFFTSAAGKYFLPYDVPPSMGDSYPLWHAVHGTTGLAYYGCPPLRSTTFTANYHHEELEIETWNGRLMAWNLVEPSAALTTYFPVEFTTILAGKPLPWPGFSKLIDGSYYDVWTRSVVPERALFANQLRILPFREIVDQFDIPFDRTIYVEQEDAGDFQLAETVLPSAPHAMRDWNNQGDMITFTVQTQTDVFVMTPTMFQLGWSGLSNGQALKLFPANYIFVGFRLPAGEHHIELSFEPPGLRLGALVNIITFALVGALWVRHKRTKPPAVL